MIMFKTNRKALKKGQSTLEYIILVAAVIAALLVFFTGGGSGGFATRIQQTMNGVSDGMLNMSSRISLSRPLAP